MTAAAARVRRVHPLLLWVGLPLLAIVGLLVVFVLLPLALFFLALKSGEEVIEKRYPSPYGRVVLVDNLRMGGGAGGYAVTTLFIEDATGKRTEVAVMRHGGVDKANWSDPQRLQVCTQGDIDSWTSPVLVKSSGAQTPIWVIQSC